MATAGSKITGRGAPVAVASVPFIESATAETAPTEAIPPDLKRTLEDYHRAEIAFQKGDAQPFKDICSHADYVTIVGGMGGVEKGGCR